MPRALGGGDEGKGRIDRELKLVLAALGTLADASPLVRRELVLFFSICTFVLALLVLKYEYSARSLMPARSTARAVAGTRFTCFTDTKVQILTLKARRLILARSRDANRCSSSSSLCSDYNY